MNLLHDLHQINNALFIFGESMGDLSNGLFFYFVALGCCCSPKIRCFLNYYFHFCALVLREQVHYMAYATFCDLTNGLGFLVKLRHLDLCSYW